MAERESGKSRGKKEREDAEAAEPSSAAAEDLEDGGWDEEEAEEASEAALAADAVLPSSGLLSFYDRLRARIVDAVESRGGKLGPAAVNALLLVPDVFVLLVRLVLDRDVPSSARALVGGALAYFVLPMDLMPEAILGGAGYLDDLVLASAVLAHTFSGELEPYARKHWSGPDDLRVVLGDIASAAQGLLGANLYDRMRKLLARRGIEVDERS